MTDELTQLAKAHGTDKAGAHHYTQHYHRHLHDLRGHPVKLLEIGIGGYDDPNTGGASLRMWKEYFPQGEIFGLDFYPKPGVAEERIKTYQGSQTDPLVIATILQDVEGQHFDVIVDDGSHRSEHVITTFMMLFPYVTQNGWYIVEDTQTSYWPTFGGSPNSTTSRITTMEFFSGLVDSLNWEEVHRPGYAPNYLDVNIVGLHFYHNLIFIKKGVNREGSNVLTANKFPDQLF